jgi:Holliday junction resolvase RusA-like endonuclease
MAFVSKSTGRPIVVDKDVRLPRWRATITSAAIEAQLEWSAITPGQPEFPIYGPIGIKVDFVLNRPKNHFGTGKNAHAVKASSPAHPGTQPDLDKLLRAVFDGLTDAQVWGDDGQVVWCQTAKHYVDIDPRWTEEGVVIEFGPMP